MGDLLASFNSIKGVKAPGNPKVKTQVINEKTGVERVINSISTFIIQVQFKLADILYGKFQIQNDLTKSGIQRALDKGVVNVLGEISNVDFCSFFNYSLTQIKGKNSFDPKKRPDQAGFEQIKWDVQKKAFDYQKLIDKYYSQWGSGIGQDSRTGLQELILQLNAGISSLVNDSDFNGDNFKKTFPETNLAINFLKQALDKFNRYSNLSAIPAGDVADVLSYIDRVRYFLVVIQSLNSPSAVANLLDLASGGKVQEGFENINKYLLKSGPDLIKFIKQILKQIQNVNSIARSLIKYINISRGIIRIFVLLIKAFMFISRYIFMIPVPSMTVPVGPIVKIGDTVTQQVKIRGIYKFINILNQVNGVLSSMEALVSSLVIAMTDISNRLNIILLNIESCNPELAAEIQAAIKDTDDAKDPLEQFLNGISTVKDSNTFGGYTIKIVTEELVDEGIKLKRRYGIALGANGVLAAQSTPTFASLDLIIINEVKVILISKGLVDIGVSDIPASDISTILESLKYLGKDNIDISDLENTTINQETDDVGLNQFINNLPGGKALRDRVRSKMAANAANFKKDLKSTDPNGTYSSNIIQS
jgi:hypothetical protein